MKISAFTNSVSNGGGQHEAGRLLSCVKLKLRRHAYQLGWITGADIYQAIIWHRPEIHAPFNLTSIE